MIVNPREILQDAERHNYAIAGINCTTVENMMAVIDAAEELGAPVMLSHAQVHEAYAPIDRFAPIMRYVAENAKVPVIIHLDHGMSMEYAMKALRNGFTSIMYDCSTLPFEENIANLKQFTDIAHPLGIIVEAELGHMPSTIVGQGGCVEAGTISVENIEEGYTNPDEALEFCERTGVDMLTVSFGSVHGFFLEKPNLDIPRLAKIYAQTKGRTNLVMHGTTGVDEDQVLNAIDNGIRKFNYFSGVGTCATKPIVEHIKKAGEVPVYYHELAKVAYETMKEEAKRVITLFQSRKK